MSKYRIDKVNSEIQKALSEIINQDLRNPIIDDKVITVVKVSTSNDISQSKVYLSILGDVKTSQKVFEEINNSKSFIRRSLASKLNLKNTPSLIFYHDESIEEGSKILSIIEEMKKKGDL